MKAVQQKKAVDSNAALEAGGHHSRPAPTARLSDGGERPVSHHAQAFARPTAVVRGMRAGWNTSRLPITSRLRPHAKNDRHEPINLTNRRDPFLSPVVLQTDMGSGCSTGKKCLSIGQIALKGIVKSDSGMIAVVVNSLDKAYFLHENDPVFQRLRAADYRRFGGLQRDRPGQSGEADHARSNQKDYHAGGVKTGAERPAEK